MTNQITVKLDKMYIADHGDPNHEPAGELYYCLRVDGKIIAEVPRTKPLKVKDRQTISLNKRIKVSKKAGETLRISGFVAEKDPGPKGNNDEKDSLNMVFRAANKYGEGRRKVTLSDGPMRVILFYEIDVEAGQTVTRNPIRPNRIASVAISSFEDSPLFNLFQNAAIAYGNCFDGYDRSVLFKRQYSAPRKPDVHIRTVTKQRILDLLTELADDGYAIDLFIFSHGSTNKIAMKDGEKLTNSDIDSLAAGRYAKGRFPIRMVWQMNCYGSSLNDNFLKIGAKAVCGARTINCFGNQFNKFARHWNRGDCFHEALEKSDTPSSRTVMHTLILADARINDFQPRCKPFQTVLGKNDCAEAFLGSWQYFGNDYKTNMSGKQNIAYGSQMIIHGNPNLRKSQIGTW